MRNRKTGYNSTFAIGGVSCSADSFVVTESSVLRINIRSEKPAHRKSANRYEPFPNNTYMENIEHSESPKVESVDSQVFVELNPEIINLDYDLWTLRITLSFTKINRPVVYVIFKDVIGFRMLDEGNLLEFWGKNRVSGWLWKVKSGGWFDLEKNRKGFVEGYVENNLREEYLVCGINDCLSVISLSEPEVIVPE